MPHELRAYLWHIEEASDHILEFTRGRSFTDYEQDSLLRAGVERKFEIIGEALKQLVHHFPEQTEWVASLRDFTGFRDVIIHQYAKVNNEIVWEAVHIHLPALRAMVLQRKAELGF
jgi:uncharacterized protein with HEPN domain